MKSHYDNKTTAAAARRLAAANLERQLAEAEALLSIGFTDPSAISIDEACEPCSSDWQWEIDPKLILSGLISAAEYRDCEWEADKAKAKMAAILAKEN